MISPLSQCNSISGCEASEGREGGKFVCVVPVQLAGYSRYMFS